MHEDQLVVAPCYPKLSVSKRLGITKLEIMMLICGQAVKLSCDMSLWTFVGFQITVTSLNTYQAWKLRNLVFIILTLMCYITFILKRKEMLGRF